MKNVRLQKNVINIINNIKSSIIVTVIELKLKCVGTEFQVLSISFGIIESRSVI